MMKETTISFEEEGHKLESSLDAEDKICKRLEGIEVKSLILQGNTFAVEAAKRVGQELAKQKFLREAHFKDIFTSRGKEVVPIAIDHLLTGIATSNTELTLLDLSDNAIGPVGSPSVEKFLRTKAASKIEKLYLNNCGMGPEGGSSISVPISELRLKEFIAGRNRLENKGAKFMFAALSEMDTLEVLKLPQNGIHVKGIKYLVEAMIDNAATLRVLDLSDNTIKSQGAYALEKFIMKAKNLETLTLSDALLRNEGFSVICDAITKSNAINTLKSANFEGNELKGKNIVDLIEVTFVKCQKGFELNLLENEFSKSELTAIQKISDDNDNIDILVDDPDDKDYEDDDDDDDSEGSGNSETDDCSQQCTGDQGSRFINSFDKLGI